MFFVRFEMVFLGPIGLSSLLYVQTMELWAFCITTTQLIPPPPNPILLSSYIYTLLVTFTQKRGGTLETNPNLLADHDTATIV